MLEGPRELILDQYLCLKFQDNNNQSEYKVVIVGLKLAKEVRVSHLLVRTDSQLVDIQIKGDFQTKDTLLLKYLQRAQQLAKGLTKFEVTHIPREENTRADLLA